MAELAATIQVQVCYARPDRQLLRPVTVAAASTLHDAIKRSGILQDAPEIDLSVWRVGIYGKLKALDTVLRERDRIEIYRPLIADPKESRRRRAEHKTEKNPH
jgi:putative ubiquitin-RnfH superfamily antitoxin RatB of RatAB toxin-antitoxin module